MRGSDDQAPSGPVEHHDPGPALLPLLVGLLAGAAGGVWLFWPFLVREHARMGTPAMVLLWVGDAASLVAFLGYCVWHVAMGVPVQSKAAPAGLLDRRLAWITASLVGSLALDLGITLFLMEKENRDFHLARTGQATVTRVRKRSFPFGTIYALDARFLDAQGVTREATFFLQDGRVEGLPWMIPLATQAAVRRGRVPFEVGIAFDPGRPQRHWLLGARWYDEDRLHTFSLVMIGAQLLAVAAFTAAVRYHVQTRKRLPWWGDLQMVLPLAIEVAAVCVLVAGEANHHRVTWWASG